MALNVHIDAEAKKMASTPLSWHRPSPKLHFPRKRIVTNMKIRFAEPPMSATARFVRNCLPVMRRVLCFLKTRTTRMFPAIPMNMIKNTTGTRKTTAAVDHCAVIVEVFCRARWWGFYCLAFENNELLSRRLRSQETITSSDSLFKADLLYFNPLGSRYMHADKNTDEKITNENTRMRKN